MKLPVSPENVNLVVDFRRVRVSASVLILCKCFLIHDDITGEGQYDVMGFGKYLFELVWFKKKKNNFVVG